MNFGSLWLFKPAYEDTLAEDPIMMPVVFTEFKKPRRNDNRHLSIFHLLIIKTATIDTHTHTHTHTELTSHTAAGVKAHRMRSWLWWFNCPSIRHFHLTFIMISWCQTQYGCDSNSTIWHVRTTTCTVYKSLFDWIVWD